MSSRKKSKRRNSDDDLDDEDDSGQDNDEGGAKWACQSCTFINRAAAFRCFVCGTRKGTSTRKSRLSENVVEMQKTINDMVIKQVEKEKSLKRKEKSLYLGPSTSTVKLEVTNSPSPDPSYKYGSPPDHQSETPTTNLEKKGKNKKIAASSRKRTASPEIKPKKEEKRTSMTKGTRSTPLPLIKIIKEEVKDEDSCEPSTSSPQGSSSFNIPTLEFTSTLTSSETDCDLPLSPAVSKQSTETESSSNLMLAKSLEAPRDGQASVQQTRSTKIPDSMIYREIPKKITVLANGVPAVFYEFPRRMAEKKNEDSK